MAIVLWTQLGLFIVATICSLIFTHRPVVITGESMRPVLDRGDVVIFDTPDLKTLRVGQVVMFDLGEGNITHRITGFHDDGTLTTRGDANGITDTSPVPRDRVEGRARVVVPFVGLPMLWVQDGNWLKLGAWGCATSAGVVLLLVSPQRQEQRERRKRWLASRRRRRAQRRQPQRTPQPLPSQARTSSAGAAPTLVQGQPKAQTAVRPAARVATGPSALKTRGSASCAAARPSWPVPRTLPPPLRSGWPAPPTKDSEPLAAPSPARSK